jgi:hypothetical protein
MEPDEPLIPPRLSFRRNRVAFLLGVTWSHDPSWPWRVTHFYLGLWTLTLRTAGQHGRQ